MHVWESDRPVRGKMTCQFYIYRLGSRGTPGVEKSVKICNKHTFTMACLLLMSRNVYFYAFSMTLLLCAHIRTQIPSSVRYFDTLMVFFHILYSAWSLSDHTCYLVIFCIVTKWHEKAIKLNVVYILLLCTDILYYTLRDCCTRHKKLFRPL